MSERSENDLSADTAAPVLTRDGRVALEEKARRLEEEVIPTCAQRLREGESDPNLIADYDRAVLELANLSNVLRRAVDAEDLPADPLVVELGDTVTLGMPDGAIERYVIVHPAEAPLDRLRISSDSPMSKAVLGHRIGEKVEVAAPVGRFQVEVLGVER